MAVDKTQQKSISRKKMCGTKIHKFSCSQINSPAKSSSNPRMNKQIHQSNKNKSQQKRMLSTLFYLEKKIHHCCSLISLWTNKKKRQKKIQINHHNWNTTQHSVEISEYSCYSKSNEINFGNSRVLKMPFWQL